MNLNNINKDQILLQSKELNYSEEEQQNLQLLLTYCPQIFAFLSISSPENEIRKLILLLKQLNPQRKQKFLSELSGVPPGALHNKILMEIENLPLLSKLSLFSQFSSLDKQPKPPINNNNINNNLSHNSNNNLHNQNVNNNLQNNNLNNNNLNNNNNNNNNNQ